MTYAPSFRQPGYPLNEDPWFCVPGLLQVCFLQRGLWGTACQLLSNLNTKIPMMMYVFSIIYYMLPCRVVIYGFELKNVGTE